MFDSKEEDGDSNLESELNENQNSEIYKHRNIGFKNNKSSNIFDDQSEEEDDDDY